MNGVGQMGCAIRDIGSLSAGCEGAMPLLAAAPRFDEQHAWLAADVGGTHARVGLVAFGADRAAPTVLIHHVYKCADYAGLDVIVRAFCDEYAVKPRRFALACAGFLHEGRVVSSHLQWPIMPAALEQMLALDEVRVLNDFEALAYATAYLGADSVMSLQDPRSGAGLAAGPVVVVGPGTGLGVAVRLTGSRPVVLATEAGHIQLAARAGREQQVLAELAPIDTHVPYDHVLSGPGLLRLYRALCRLERQPVVFEQPEALTSAASAGEDALAVETLQMFCAWLGSYAGDLAMLYGATGGIYIAGGFLARMIGFVRKSAFIHRFLDKGTMRPFLQSIPVHVMDHGQLGVIGAASWLMSRSMHNQEG